MRCGGCGQRMVRRCLEHRARESRSRGGSQEERERRRSGERDSRLGEHRGRETIVNLMREAARVADVQAFKKGIERE